MIAHFFSLLLASFLLLIFVAHGKKKKTQCGRRSIVTTSPGRVYVCTCAWLCAGMYISKKIFSNPFFSKAKRHTQKKTARIETETNRTEKSIPLRVIRDLFFLSAKCYSLTRFFSFFCYFLCRIKGCNCCSEKRNRTKHGKKLFFFYTLAGRHRDSNTRLRALPEKGVTDLRRVLR